jgi:hypothetical protein
VSGVREGSNAPKLVAVALAAVATVWVWTATQHWNLFDLQETSWRHAFNGLTWLAALSLVAALAAVRTRRHGIAPSRGRWLREALLWAIPVFSFTAIGVTVGLLAFDATRTPWTPLRQTLEALGGRSNCGLADRFGGSDGFPDEIARSGTATLVAPQLVPYVPCARTPAIENGVVETPALMVLELDVWPLTQRESPFTAFIDLYPIRDVALGPHGVRMLRVTPAVPGYAVADAVLLPAGTKVILR